MPMSLRLVCFAAIFHLLLNASAQGSNKMRYRSGNYIYVSSTGFSNIRQDTLLAGLGIREVHQATYELNKKTQKRKSFRYQTFYYDSLGYQIKTTEGKKENSQDLMVIYQTNPEHLVTNHKIIKKGKTLYEQQYWYVNDHNMLEYRFYKKGKLKNIIKYSYNNRKLLKVETFGSDTGHLQKITTYKYENDTGRLLETVLKSGKGKTIRRWDYTCEPLGNLSKSEAKKEVRVCKNRDTLANGHRREVYEYVVKNSTTRYIYEYDSQNRMVELHKFTGKFGEVLSFHEVVNFTDSGYSQMRFAFNNHTGVPTGKWILRVNRNGQTTFSSSEYYTRKGKYRTGYQDEFVFNGPLLKRKTSTNMKNPKQVYIEEYNQIVQ